MYELSACPNLAVFVSLQRAERSYLVVWRTAAAKKTMLAAERCPGVGGLETSSLTVPWPV